MSEQENQQTENDDFRKLQLVGCESYTVTNPNPEANYPIIFKRKNPKGERLTYKVSTNLARALLPEVTHTGMPYFADVTSMQAPGEMQLAQRPMDVVPSQFSTDAAMASQDAVVEV